jgi:sugar phosphate isomerase/epimerase
MQFALSTGSLYSYGLGRVFALAAQAGFDGLEVLIDWRYDTRQPGYLQRLMERYQIPVLSVHVPFHPARLQHWPHSQEHSIAAAARLATAVGAKVVVVHLPRSDEKAYAHWLCHDFASWQQAHPQPVIAVENMPVKWSRWWPFGPREAWQMNRVEQWGEFPHLNLDTTHLGTKGLDPVLIYEQLRDRVVHVHLSNALRRGKRVWEHRRVEDGFLSLDKLIQRLSRDSFDGIVTVELHPEALEAHDEDRVLFHLQRQIAFCRENCARSA